MRFLKALFAFLFVAVLASTLASHVHAGPVTGFEPQVYVVGQPSADSRSLLDPTRIQFAVGLQRAWYTNTAPLAPHDEWEGVLAGSYNIIPNLDAVGSVARGFTSEGYRWTAGVRAVIFRGVK